MQASKGIAIEDKGNHLGTSSKTQRRIIPPTGIYQPIHRLYQSTPTQLPSLQEPDDAAIERRNFRIVEEKCSEHQTQACNKLNSKAFLLTH